MGRAIAVAEEHESAPNSQVRALLTLPVAAASRDWLPGLTAVGNRALSRAILARCGCGCGGTCGSKPRQLARPGLQMRPDEEDQFVAAMRKAAVARRAAVPVAAAPRRPAAAAAAPVVVARRARPARPTRTLARFRVFAPPYRPSPSWSHRDPSQPADDCVPFDILDAADEWDVLRIMAMAGITQFQPDCVGDVRDIYLAYLDANGSPSFSFNEKDGLSCVVKALKSDPDHEAAEQPVIDAVVTALPGLVPKLRGVPSVTLSLTDAGVPVGLIHPDPAIGCPTANADDSPACLWLSHNNRPGGLLFGKGHENGTITDSEYGNDTRRLDGTVELTKVGIANDPAHIQVSLKFRLNWQLTDAVDFCPGNTMPGRGIAHDLLNGLSRLEASGMARDIRLEANYWRDRDKVAGPFPNPDLTPVPSPPPTHVLPAEALFDFDSAKPKATARDEIIARLGLAGRTFNLAQPVEVVGHTDSIPGPTSDYNQRLSERRAAAIAALLVSIYPALAGHVNTSGKGDTEPIADNGTAAGRAKNRRVEITVDELGSGP